MTTPVRPEHLTKRELLLVLEYVPQHFWPPRPTRQIRATLLSAIRRAEASGRYVFDVTHASGDR